DPARSLLRHRRQHAALLHRGNERRADQRPGGLRGRLRRPQRGPGRALRAARSPQGAVRTTTLPLVWTRAPTGPLVPRRSGFDGLIAVEAWPDARRRDDGILDGFGGAATPQTAVDRPRGTHQNHCGEVLLA